MFLIKILIFLSLALAVGLTRADKVESDELLDKALDVYARHGGASLTRVNIYIWSQRPDDKAHYIFLADLKNDSGRITHNQVIAVVRNGEIEGVVVAPVITHKSV